MSTAHIIAFPSQDQQLPQVAQLLDEVRAALRRNADQLHQANEQLQRNADELRRNADQLHQIDLAIMGLKRVDLPALGPSVELLTEREIEIVRLVASGYNNRQIALQLVLAEGTVSNHMTHILAKLNATNRAEAVSKARLLGII